MSTSRKFLALGLGLAGSGLLATPTLAMTELPSGYANRPPTTAPTPPPTGEIPPLAEQRAADAHHGEAKGSQEGSGAEQKPAAEAAVNGGSAPRADKGMEGKCGEGKCGGGI